MPTVEYLNYEVMDDHGWSMDDDDLFDEAADAGLGDEDYGSLDVAEGEYILEAAEAQGFDWPFSCRAGACANCAAIVKEGDIDMDMQQILSDEEVEEKNVRLTVSSAGLPMQVRRTFFSSTSSSERICCMSMSMSPSLTMAAQLAQAPARHENGQSKPCASAASRMYSPSATSRLP